MCQTEDTETKTWSLEDERGMEQALGQTGVVITIMVVTCKNPRRMEYDCPRKVSLKRQVLYGGEDWKELGQRDANEESGTERDSGHNL